MYHYNAFYIWRNFVETSNLVTIILAVIGVFGGKELWSYLRNRTSVKAKQNSEIIKLREEQLKKSILALKQQLTELEKKLDDETANRTQIEKELQDLKIRIAVAQERLANYALRSRGSKSNDI